MSSVHHYDVDIRVLLARIFGVRMCWRCPHCNCRVLDWDGKDAACQNKFGNNAMALGGACGMCDALALATEHQGEGTPHVHGIATFVCPYQFKTLQDIAEMIEKELLESIAVAADPPLMRLLWRPLSAHQAYDTYIHAMSTDCETHESTAIRNTPTGSNNTPSSAAGCAKHPEFYCN